MSNSHVDYLTDELIIPMTETDMVKLVNEFFERVIINEFLEKIKKEGEENG
jgi:hypothetical protein